MLPARCGHHDGLGEIAEQILSLDFALALLVVVVGSIVRGYTGFGSGLVMAPFLAMLWGPVAAVGTIVSLGTLSFFQMARQAAPLAAWRDVAPLMAAAVVITPLGTYSLISLDPLIVKRIIAAAVLIVALISLRGWTYSGPRGLVPGFIAGSIAALINGVAAVGGPPLVLYLMSLPGKPETHRANTIMAMGAASSVIVLYMSLAGAFDQLIWLRIAFLLPANFLGIWIGSHMFRLLPGEVFRIIVLWVLVAVSISILIAS